MDRCVVNKRVLKDIQDAQESLSKEFGIYIQPEEGNYYNVHFVFPGPPDTPYFGGLYHGLLKLNQNHPMGPPNVHMITPSGRFTPESYPCNGRGICTSFTSYHPDTWSPMITIDTIIKGLISFMCDNKDSGVGSIQGIPDAQRAKLATDSLRVLLTDQMVIELFPELVVSIQTGAYVPHNYNTKKETVNVSQSKPAIQTFQKKPAVETESKPHRKQPVKKVLKKVESSDSETESESESESTESESPQPRRKQPTKKIAKKPLKKAKSESDSSETESESVSDSPQPRRKQTKTIVKTVKKSPAKRSTKKVQSSSSESESDSSSEEVVKPTKKKTPVKKSGKK